MAYSRQATDRLLTLLRRDQPQPAERQALAGNAAAWQEIVEASVKLRVAPLLYDAAGSRPDLPEGIADHLRGYYLATAVAGTARQHHLRDVLRALSSQQIDVIVLKGAYLAAEVYQDIALRPMTDIDLLVPRAELARVERLLVDMGFGGPLRRPLAEQCSSDRYHIDEFRRQDTVIEVHWCIEREDAPFHVDLAGIWSRASRFTVAGAPARALSPEDLILHLCLSATFNHGWYHFETGLLGCCDIAAIGRRFGNQIDWPAVAARASEWGTANCTWLMLRLANQLVDAQVPPAALQALAPPALPPGVEACAISLALRWDSAFRHFDALGDHLPSITQILREVSYCPWGMKQLVAAALFPADRVLAKLYPQLPRFGHRAAAHLARWKDVTAECLRYHLMPDANTRAWRTADRQRFRLTLWLLGFSHPPAASS